MFGSFGLPLLIAIVITFSSALLSVPLGRGAPWQLDPYRHGDEWFVKVYGWLLAAVTAALVMTVWAVNHLPDSVIVRWLIQEAGFWESVQALALLSASGCILWTTFRYGRGLFVAKGAVAVGVAALLLLAALEETNWGQHWIKYPTPPILAKWKGDGGMNLHDIGFGSNVAETANIVLQSMAWLFLVIMPLLARYSKPAQHVINRLGVPTPPLAFTPFAIIGLMIGWMPGFDALTPMWSVSELQETLFYLVALGGAVSHNLRWHQCITCEG